MQFLHGHFLTALSALALAIPCISTADDDIFPDARESKQTHFKDPQPATCKQFEKLFPKAIKYPEQGYYTLSINGSPVITFYNQDNEIALIFILTQARRNAPKLSQILHMSYNIGLTERGKNYHHAVLYNDKALFRFLPPLTQEDAFETPETGELFPPFTLINLLGLIIRTNTYVFYDWNRRGITFISKDETKKVVYSAHSAESPIVHFHFTGIDKNSLTSYPYPPLGQFQQYFKTQSRESKKTLKLSGLESITHYHPEEKIAFGHAKNGIRALGKISNRYPLDSIPSCAPKPTPKEREEWPSVSLVTLQKEEEKIFEKKTETTDTKTATEQITTPVSPQEPQQKAIHLPLTPKEALDAYLKHLQSF